MTAPKRILVVDDEPMVVRMVSDRLRMEGYDVLVAMDGQEGLAKAQTEAPDLIILDLMLPNLNGYSVCSVLKRDPRYQKIPIVIFTAKIDESEEEMKLLSGADAFVRKPFKASELLGQLTRLLGPSST
ncbi:MAG: response regulator [Candidatus Omnitrophica bacterium]|nr:response regulator [Candidatus Omnitrophota bacterium]